MSESTDLRVVGAMIDIIEQFSPGYDFNGVNETIDRLETILIDGTSIRIDRRQEIVTFVKERYWQEPQEELTDAS